MIVPVYGVEDYLGACLASVLQQPQADLEVIAVDDASPDGSGAMLDAYAAADPRIRVRHLSVNVGLGAARNVGLDLARGDFVLLLDSDDLLTEGALAAVTARLAADEVDVLIMDHARTYPDGRRVLNRKSGVLAQLGTGTFTAAEHPEIFDFLQVAWNKVYRRTFLQRIGLRFPTGYYEDTAWTHISLLEADHIAALPLVCVLYRQRPQGSILSSQSRRHFDAFDQWQLLVDYLDAHPDLARWRPLIAKRAADHYAGVLRATHRLRPEDRAEFLAQAAQRTRAHYGAPIPWADTNAKVLTTLGLVGFDAFTRASHGAQRVRTTALAGRRRAGRLARRVLRRAHHEARMGDYRRALRDPLDPHLALYSALWDRGVTGNPAALCEAMRRVAPEINPVWVVRASAVAEVPPGVRVVTPDSRTYVEALARATYLISDVNFPDYVVKRPGQIHVQAQHGTPLKHMGLDLRDHPVAAKGMDFDKLLVRAARWDYNLSSNPYSTAVWAKAFPVPFTTLESGYPRNDVLVTATADDVARARAALGLPVDTLAVLYAPTHRDADAGFNPRVLLAGLADALGPGATLLVRTHYFYADEHTTAATAGRMIDVSAQPAVEPLLLAADVLITDYSSIMFDYANLDRPIVSLIPDWAEYRAVRGVYFDLPAEPPGIVARNLDELADAFASGAYDGPEAARLRAAFRERFCPFDDGRAADRVARVVFRNEPMLPITPPAERPTVPRPSHA